MQRYVRKHVNLKMEEVEEEEEIPSTSHSSQEKAWIPDDPRPSPLA